MTGFFSKITNAVKSVFQKTVTPQARTQSIEIDMKTNSYYIKTSDGKSDKKPLTDENEFKHDFITTVGESIVAGMSDITNKDITMTKDLNSDKIVLENLPPEDVKAIEQISTANLGTRDLGRSMAQTAFRTTSPDVYDRTKIVQESELLVKKAKEEGKIKGKSQKSLDTLDRLYEWVIGVKLINSNEERDKLNNMPFEERAKELDRIVFRIYRHLIGV